MSRFEVHEEDCDLQRVSTSSDEVASHTQESEGGGAWLSKHYVMYTCQLHLCTRSTNPRRGW